MSTTTEAPETVARYAVLDGRSSKALALACSTEPGRPLFHFARVREDGVLEATTGHILTRIVPDFWTEDGELHTKARTEAETEWHIHRDDLKRPKVSEYLRLDLETGELAVLDKNREPATIVPGGAAKVGDNLDNGTNHPAFPNTDAVYNSHTRPDCFRFRVSYDYLAKLAKMARAAHGGRDGGITLEVPKDIEEKTRAGSRGAVQGIRYVVGDTEGLLMPWRLDR